jgi:hypothetical protein
LVPPAWPTSTVLAAWVGALLPVDGAGERPDLQKSAGRGPGSSRLPLLVATAMGAAGAAVAGVRVLDELRRLAVRAAQCCGSRGEKPES